MAKNRAKGQAERLSLQHLIGKGVVGIFGEDARVHDADIRKVAQKLLELLRRAFPGLTFRIRSSITKQEIHNKLRSIDSRLGVSLYTPSASIRPDGGIIEVQDNKGNWRVILTGETKHQGNDIRNITTGTRTPAMERKGQYIMPAGNAIERVHKNIQEMKNLMLSEKHFPYVVFLQGSNFATEALTLKWPDGTPVVLVPSDSSINRIDRVTACNYGMKININHCRNLIIEHPFGRMMLQVASIYAQCDLYNPDRITEICWQIALTSLEVLTEELPATSMPKL